ncbi:MAG: DUF2314 domain-containing protein [Actinomycetia bacterium]|nr:DUF2314 domain-containing protein [Actinomycetes bacterium]
MRLPDLDEDSWDLESAEARNRANPDSFQIPDRIHHERLLPGLLAKLLFRIAPEGETASTTIERMWVMVTGEVDGTYMGMLENAPATELGTDHYLVRGAEIAFGPEHVIDVELPPPDAIGDLLRREPTHRWPRT